jgi:CheY-like chemotaxis protein
MHAQFKVLVADDSHYDRFLMERCVGRCSCLKLVGSVPDGQQVLHWLAGKGAYSDRNSFPLPDLLLLDAVMNGTNALQILTWLHEHPIPELKVVIFTGSSTPTACEQFLRYGAHACYQKAIDFDELKSDVEQVANHLLAGMYNLVESPLP